jgi:hypothetical protein
MLLAWMPPRWALLGALLVAFHPIVLLWSRWYSGGAIGVLGGASLAVDHKLTRGDIALVDTLAGIGTAGGLTLGMLMQPAQKEAYAVNALLGATGGVIAGYVAGPQTNTTPRRMLRVAGVAAAGGALPFLLYAGIHKASTTADERITFTPSSGISPTTTAGNSPRTELITLVTVLGTFFVLGLLLIGSSAVFLTLCIGQAEAAVTLARRIATALTMAFATSYWQLVGPSLVIGLASALTRPAWSALPPRLVGDETMPALLVFLALFGGVEVLGLRGLIIGPVVMALAVAVLRLYAREAEATKASAP